MSKLLQNNATLSSHLEAARAAASASADTQSREAVLAAFLQEVHAAIPDQLGDPGFLKRLWDENPVAKTGMGSVPVGPALDDADFRAWFAQQVRRPLPTDPAEATARLVELYDETALRLQDLCGKRPILKLNRVLAALYPSHFTTIANVGLLMELHEAIGGRSKDHPVRAHESIRARIDSAMGPAPSESLQETTHRMCLGWYLYTHILRGDKGAADPELSAPDELVPLPAVKRRKGITAIKGSFQSLLGYIEDLADGLSPDEFRSAIQARNPALVDSSVNTLINVVRNEFGLCRLVDGTYRLTPRGINLRETLDPDELADKLLTSVLGVDHVLARLRTAPAQRSELLQLLRQVNPGWTADFGPSSIVKWLVSLDVISPDDHSTNHLLTERGRRWADRISWTPEMLGVDRADTAGSAMAQSSLAPSPAVPTRLALPSTTDVMQRLAQRTGTKLAFSSELVARLHTGLWSHPVRHFAVLTGISGSGKTQLALNYALALTPSALHVRVVRVQPGWFDPGPLLGYVDPLREASYRSTEFLQLLLKANDDPGNPHVIILDEMNLSHPEQYFAPILSAMETAGWPIDLHQIEDIEPAVPNAVPYPANLAVIGTLNMDETTHGLSDKVLDRAFTLEFWDIDVDAFPGWHGLGLDAHLAHRTRTVLKDLSRCLAPVRLHFGWRTIDDVLRYLAFDAADPAGEHDRLDAVVYAKVLPKLRGDASERFRQALKDSIAVMRENGLERCLSKLEQMAHDLEHTGSVRFWR